MSKRVIIYAEDDEGIRKITSQLLETMGYEVHSHENGREALNAIRELTQEGTPVLLLTDNQMPDMDGISLLQALADENRRVPSIMLSATENLPHALREAGVESELDIVLKKPLSVVPLREALRSVCDKYDRLEQGASGRSEKDDTPRRG